MNIPPNLFWNPYNIYMKTYIRNNKVTKTMFLKIVTIFAYCLAIPMSKLENNYKIRSNIEYEIQSY